MSYSSEDRIHFYREVLKFRVTEEPRTAKPVLRVSDKVVLRVGGIMTLIGRERSRKTTVAKDVILSSGVKAAFLDLEQDPWDTWDSIARSIPGSDVFNLKGKSRTEIKAYLDAIARSGDYDVIVIDNMSYLMTDALNSADALDLKSFLLRLSIYTPLLCIIHENKTNSNSVGPL